jgi:glutamate carboxypeptidase
MDPWVTDQAQLLAASAAEELKRVVEVSSIHGDKMGAERMVSALTTLLPKDARVDRVPCSSPGFADDVLINLEGTGHGRLLLIGHLDTVAGGHPHRALTRTADVWGGTGTYDMKGGLLIACGVLRALAKRPQSFEEVLLLITCDEEGRTRPLHHTDAPWVSADACLCFEGGEAAGSQDAVVVRRKLAATLTVVAAGTAAHAGASIREGRSALQALAKLSRRLETRVCDIDEEITVTPTLLNAGEAINQVPEHGELICDVRAFSSQAARNMLGLVPGELDDVILRPAYVERFPAMDSRAAATPLLETATRYLDRPLLGIARGGSSDASFFARHIPVTVDGLGPLGGRDHSPQEHVLGSSFPRRYQVALACALAALENAA